MKKIGLLVKTDGTKEPVAPKNGTDFSINELQAFVGGYIEIITIKFDGKDYYMVVNEEGKLNGLPYNEAATELYQKTSFWGDCIVGDALICDTDMIE